MFRNAITERWQQQFEAENKGFREETQPLKQVRRPLWGWQKFHADKSTRKRNRNAVIARHSKGWK